MELAIRTLLRSCAILGINMKDSKTLAGRVVTFMGLSGYFPGPENKMSLRTTLHPEKVLRWPNLIKQYINHGAIREKELGSLIGKLSFSQRAVFGRMGRAMMCTLYEKLNDKPYQKKLEEKDLYTFRWWIETMRLVKPRTAVRRERYPKYIVYTDAATKKEIIAAILITREKFTKHQKIDLCTSSVTGGEWSETFAATSHIYGLEMLALMAMIWERGERMRGSCVTFYIDNQNARKALIKIPAKP